MDMARTKRERHPDPMNPFDGQPGFWNHVNKVVYRLAGPAQVGSGRHEAPYVPPADPACPLCDRPMRDHVIDRTGHKTQLYCP